MDCVVDLSVTHEPVLYCCNSGTSFLPQKCSRFTDACFHLRSVTEYYCDLFWCSSYLALLLQNDSFPMGPVPFHLTLTLCCACCSLWGHRMPQVPLVHPLPQPWGMPVTYRRGAARGVLQGREPGSPCGMHHGR